MAATDEMTSVALSIRPDVVTLVPERREELTTEGGLDVAGGGDRLANIVGRVRDGGIRVSLFVDPDLDHVKEALRIGAQAVEIHTGRYANAATADECRGELDRISDAVSLARKIGLEPLAGHGLNVRNVAPVARIPGLAELNIGHSIVSRAVAVGMVVAVREMLDAMHRA
jgi:pyridoxine 5-phosphate synthase